MFDSLAAAIAHNTVLAGADFAWHGTRGTSRHHSDVQPAFRMWLWTAQGGLCAACGLDLDRDTMEVAHVVGNGGHASKARGYTHGNVYGSHGSAGHDCNAIHYALYGEIVPVHGFARADLIPLTYPTRQDLYPIRDMLDMAAERKAGAARAAAFRILMGLKQAAEDEPTQDY